MDKKVVRVGNIIDFHSDAKKALKENQDKRKNKLVSKSPADIVVGLGQPNRKIDFLNSQLGNAKNELAMFRQNHNALVEQIVFVQKDFKRRLRIANEGRRNVEKQYQKAVSDLKAKDKDFALVSKNFADLKTKFNGLHTAYSQKIEKFKEQHKERLTDDERAVNKKIMLLSKEKDKLQRNVGCLMDAVYQKSEGIVSLEREAKSAKERIFNLQTQNQSLTEYKRINAKALEDVTAELKALEAEYHSILRKLKQKEKDYELLKFKHSNLNEDSERNQKSVDTYKEKQFALKNEIEQYKIKIKGLEETITELKDSQESAIRLSAELKDSQIEAANLKITIENLNKAVEASSEEKIILKEEIDAHKQKIEQLSKSEFDLKEKYRQSAASFEMRLQKMTDKNFELSNKESALIASLDQIKITVSEKDEAISEFKNENTKLRAELKSETDLKAAAEKDLFAAKAVEKELNTEIFGLKTSTGKLRNTIETKEDEISSLNGKLEEIENLNDQLNAECGSLEEHVQALSEELRSVSEQHQASMNSVSSFNEKVTNLSSEILDLKEDKESLEMHAENLKSELTIERERLESLESTIAEQSAEIERANERGTEFVDAKQEWSDEKEALELRINRFMANLSEKDSEILEKQTEIEDNISKIKDLNLQFDSARVEITKLEEKCRASKRDAEAAYIKFDNLSVKFDETLTNLKEKESAEMKLQSVIEEMERKNLGKEYELSSLEKRISESTKVLDSQKAEFEEQIEVLRETEQKALFQAKDLESELKTSKADVARAEDEVSKLKAEIDMYQEKIGTFEEAMASSGEESLDARHALKETEHKITTLKTQLTVAAEKEEKLKRTLADKDMRINELLKEVESNKEDLAAHKDLETRFEAISNKEEGTDVETSKRREELDLYSKWVDSQKESLKKHIVRFSQELKMSLTINPLHSYLTMTEAELTKIETLLSKPGVVGVQRNHLEEHKQALVEQRQYINEMVEKTKADVEKRVAEVMGLLKQGEFIPVPPLPPQRKG